MNAARALLLRTFPSLRAETLRQFRVLYEDGRVAVLSAEDNPAAVAAAQQTGPVRGITGEELT